MCQVFSLLQHLNKDAFKAILPLHVSRRAAAPTKTLVLPPLTQTVMCERNQFDSKGRGSQAVLRESVYKSSSVVKGIVYGGMYSPWCWLKVWLCFPKNFGGVLGMGPSTWCNEASSGSPACELGSKKGSSQFRAPKQQWSSPDVLSHFGNTVLSLCSSCCHWAVFLSKHLSRFTN